MKGCHFCQVFLNDWNQIVDELQQQNKSIAFLLIDGQE
jgi:hypothetical protein